ncbi:MAG: WS/DGAT/MGAT family O-acyltransferase [Actinomycetota bacterium]
MAERLSPLDASFLYLEQPNVHMHVGGVAILDPSTHPKGRLSLDELASLISDRIHLVPRFRQKVVFVPLGAGRPVWVDDAHFDLDFHIRRAALPSPGGMRELTDQVQRVHSRPLDRSKPLWEAYLIEGLEDGHVAVFTKVHHAMIDGISGMDIGTVLFDFAEKPRRVRPEPWKPAPEPSPLELLREALVETVSHPVRSVVENAALAIQTPQIIIDRARRVLGGLGTMAATGLASRGPFDVTVGAARRFAMTEVPVSDAKAIKNALGGKVNDVILAAVASALHELLKARGIASRGMTLRAMVPVSTRDESQRMALGNQVSSIFVDLPVGPMKPAARLKKVVAATGDLKSSHAAVAATALINLTKWAPPTLHALAARLLARQRFANLVVSNVPGPQIPLYLARARLIAYYPVMPLAETTGLSVAVTSLSGTMGFGFTSDWDALPDIEVLADGLQSAFQDLKKAASV